MRSSKPKRGPATAVVAAIAATVTVLALAALALARDPGAPARSAATPSCEEASIDATAASRSELRRGATCLVNRARREHGLERLYRDDALKLAAQRHTRVMIETDCMSHRCPGEPSLETRLRRAGYFEGARRWEYAENTGCAASAAAMVEKWLESTYHRVNILDPRFADIGIGVSTDGRPKRCEEGFATFTAIFAWRRT